MLAAELVWFHRLNGGSKAGDVIKLGTASKSFAELSSEWGAVEPDWQGLVATVDEAFDALAFQHGRWVSYIDSLSDADFLGAFDCFHADGKSFAERPLRSNTLLHVFNHGTHHRGQASAAVVQLGGDSPAMDYTYFLLEQASLTCGAAAADAEANEPAKLRSV